MTDDTWLATDVYLGAIEADAGTMVSIARTVDLATPVPTCPGWTLRDLIIHTGIVHRDKAEIVRGGWVDERPPHPTPPDGEVIDWFESGAHDMLAVFRSADLTRRSYTWCDHEHSAAWWVRRMAQETAVHRSDAEVSVGIEPVLDAELAIDGIDEILDEMLVGAPDWATEEPQDSGVALVTATRRWQLRFGTFSGTSPWSGTTYESADMLLVDSGVVPAATVSTDPSTLDLWLWGRVPLPIDAVSGDRAVAERLRALAAEATG